MARRCREPRQGRRHRPRPHRARAPRVDRPPGRRPRPPPPTSPASTPPRPASVSIPLIFTQLGEPLAADIPLVDGGVDTGDVLVASTTVHRPPTDSSAKPRRRGRAAALTIGCGAAVGAGAGRRGGDRRCWRGWFAARHGLLALDTVSRRPAAGRARSWACCPIGVHRHVRALAAPAFAGAAAFALRRGDRPGEAADRARHRRARGGGRGGRRSRAGRAVRTRRPGSGSSRAPGSSRSPGWPPWLDLPPRATWSLLLVLAMLAARVVPAMAVDVPDNFLIDMDRLAITAWSRARRPRSRRGRVVVPEAAVVGRGDARRRRSSRPPRPRSSPSRPCRHRCCWTPRTCPSTASARGRWCSSRWRAAPRVRAAIGTPAARQLLRLAGLACWVALTWALVPVLSDGQWLAVGRRRGRAGRGAGGGRRRDRPGLALGLVVASGRGGRGPVLLVRHWPRSSSRPASSASCGNRLRDV